MKFFYLTGGILSLALVVPVSGSTNNDNPECKPVGRTQSEDGFTSNAQLNSCKKCQGEFDSVKKICRTSNPYPTKNFSPSPPELSALMEPSPKPGRSSRRRSASHPKSHAIRSTSTSPSRSSKTMKLEQRSLLHSMKSQRWIKRVEMLEAKEHYYRLKKEYYTIKSYIANLKLKQNSGGEL